MKVLTAFKDGSNQVTAHGRMWLFLYVCNLVFALLAAIPLRNWIKDVAGHSLDLSKNLGQFDFTFLTDLTRNYSGFSILWNVLWLVGFAYLLFSAFLSGGIMDSLIHRRARNRTNDFLLSGIQYFWRMVKAAICFLLMHIALLAIFIGIIMTLGANPKEMDNDVRFLLYMKLLLVVYVFLALVVVIAHDYVKIHIVREVDISFGGAFRTGIRFVRQNFGQIILLYVINLLILVILFLIYTTFKRHLPDQSMAGIMGMFILGQVFLFGRIGVKLMILSSANALIPFKV